MKEFKFNSAEIPILKEITTNKNYYSVGTDNKFFDHLIYLYENSSSHSTFVNNLSSKIVGSGLVGTTDKNQLIIDSTNFNDIFLKTSLDYSLYGGWCVEIIWNALHTKINQINYIDFSKIRSGFIDDETDDVLLYYYSPDWSKYRKEVTIIQSYNEDEITDNVQILYVKDHSPGLSVYPKPIYYGSLGAIYTDVELNKYYANLVKNNFIGNKIITVSVPMDAERQVSFEEGFKKQFTTSENAGSIMVIYADGSTGERSPLEIVDFNQGPDDQKYQWLSQNVLDQIIIGHRIPNPIIAGVRISGSLGGSQEMIDSEIIYNKNVIHPKRDTMVSEYNKLIKLYKTPFDYKINDNNLFIEKNTE